MDEFDQLKNLANNFKKEVDNFKAEADELIKSIKFKAKNNALNLKFGLNQKVYRWNENIKIGSNMSVLKLEDCIRICEVEEIFLRKSYWDDGKDIILYKVTGGLYEKNEIHPDNLFETLEEAKIALKERYDICVKAYDNKKKFNDLRNKEDSKI